MTRHHPLQLKSRRATAWFLLLVCLWMGSGGVLHHTEAEFSGQAGHRGPSGFHRSSAAAPADSCAACEWTQGLQGRTLAVTQVVAPYLAPRPLSGSVASSPLRRVARLGSPRAPPPS